MADPSYTEVKTPIVLSKSVLIIQKIALYYLRSWINLACTPFCFKLEYLSSTLSEIKNCSNPLPLRQLLKIYFWRFYKTLS